MCKTSILGGDGYADASKCVPWFQIWAFNWERWCHRPCTLISAFASGHGPGETHIMICPNKQTGMRSSRPFSWPVQKKNSFEPKKKGPLHKGPLHKVGQKLRSSSFQQTYKFLLRHYSPPSPRIFRYRYFWLLVGDSTCLNTPLESIL